MFRAGGGWGRRRRGRPRSRIPAFGARARPRTRTGTRPLVVLGRRRGPSRWLVGRVWRFCDFVWGRCSLGRLDDVSGWRRLNRVRAFRRRRWARDTGVSDRLDCAHPHRGVGAAGQGRGSEHQYRRGACRCQRQLPACDRAVCGWRHVEPGIGGHGRRRRDAIQLRSQAFVKVRPQLISHFPCARS
jgi:hypothetical protein